MEYTVQKLAELQVLRQERYGIMMKLAFLSLPG